MRARSFMPSHGGAGGALGGGGGSRGPWHRASSEDGGQADGSAGAAVADDCDADSEDDYDAEEERVRGFWSRVEYNRAVHAELAEQQARLREYREGIELQRRWDAENERIRAKLGEATERWFADDVDTRARERVAAAAAARVAAAMEEEERAEEAARRFQSAAGGTRGAGPAPPPPPSAKIADWHAHEEAFQRFADAPPDAISADAIPWPPEPWSHILSTPAAALLRETECGEHRDAELLQAYRRAYRAMALRWHPDKFEQRFGTAVDAAGSEEAERVRRRVQDVAQAVQSAWDEACNKA